MSSTQKTPTNINNIYVINNNDNEDEKKGNAKNKII